MTPGFNVVPRYTSCPQLQKEAAITEKALLPVPNGSKEEEHMVDSTAPQKGNDPLQWDEAWFANYE